MALSTYTGDTYPSHNSKSCYRNPSVYCNKYSGPFGERSFGVLGIRYPERRSIGVSKNWPSAHFFKAPRGKDKASIAAFDTYYGFRV